jgi:hypothetical protein
MELEDERIRIRERAGDQSTTTSRFRRREPPMLLCNNNGADCPDSAINVPAD